MTDAFTGRDVERLILNDPAEYERLLHSYTLLLGQRKMWWERVADAESDGWKRCVRKAIAQCAKRAGLEPSTLAEWLDLEEFTKTRMRILEAAREMMKGRS